MFLENGIEMNKKKFGDNDNDGLFVVNLKADLNGSHGRGTLQFECTANKLKELFGEPSRGDEYKVSHEWIFESEHYPGKVFSIYDWKATSLYSSDLPDHNGEFLEEEYLWHIGSNADDEAVRKFRKHIALMLY